MVTIIEMLRDLFTLQRSNMILVSATTLRAEFKKRVIIIIFLILIKILIILSCERSFRNNGE